MATSTAIGVPETVDFTKLTNLSELWATASLPVDTYTSGHHHVGLYERANFRAW